MSSCAYMLNRESSFLISNCSMKSVTSVNYCLSRSSEKELCQTRNKGNPDSGLRSKFHISTYMKVDKSNPQLYTSYGDNGIQQQHNILPL